MRTKDSSKWTFGEQIRDVKECITFGDIYSIHCGEFIIWYRFQVLLFTQNISIKYVNHEPPSSWSPLRNSLWISFGASTTIDLVHWSTVALILPLQLVVMQPLASIIALMARSWQKHLTSMSSVSMVNNRWWPYHSLFRHSFLCWLWFVWHSWLHYYHDSEKATKLRTTVEASF